MKMPLISLLSSSVTRRATAAFVAMPLALQNTGSYYATRKPRSSPSPWALPARNLQHHPIWEDADLSHIFENNRRWVKNALKEDPDFFKKLKFGQVAGNIANLVVNTDVSLLSVLEYSIHVLEVKDIFVVGHYQCGGVKAAMTNKDHGLLEHWIRNIRDVQRMHKDELDSITDPEAQWNRMVELNVQEQCINLFANPIVQRKQAESGFPRIHGFVYDIGEGLLRKLDIDFKAEVRKNLAIYKLYDFKNSGILKKSMDKEEQEEELQKEKAASKKEEKDT